MELVDCSRPTDQPQQNTCHQTAGSWSTVHHKSVHQPIADVDRLLPPTRQLSERYGGARLCRALYTRTASLNSIRRRTGSQWSCRKTGLMCSRRPVCVVSPAAAFCTDCRHWKRYSVMPLSIELRLCFFSEESYETLKSPLRFVVSTT